MKKCFLLLLTFIMVISLVSCGGAENKENEDIDSSITPDSGKVDGTAFVSDWSAGQKNIVGNIWTNRTFCRQGDYVYHFNENKQCLEKWKVHEGIESAEEICFVNTSMFLEPIGNENHIEVVGDYIYLCIASGDEVHGRKMNSILQIRTDGQEQNVVAKDCLGAQYRIVDGVLFYLTLLHKQTSATTEWFSVAVKAIDIGDGKTSLGLGQSVLVEGTEIIDEQPETNPRDFFVVKDGDIWVAGYYDENYVYDPYQTVRNTLARIDILKVTNGYLAQTKTANDFGGISAVDSQGRIYGYEKRGYYSGKDVYDMDVAYYVHYDMAEGSKLVENGRVLCVADDLLFYYKTQDGLYQGDLTYFESKKINNDAPDAIEYVGDGKVYYYYYASNRGKILCSCDLNDSDWQEIYVIHSLGE